MGTGVGTGRIGQAAGLSSRRAQAPIHTETDQPAQSERAADRAKRLAPAKALTASPHSTQIPRRAADHGHSATTALPGTLYGRTGFVGGLPLTACPLDIDENPDRRAERRLAERRAAVARYDAVLGRIAGSEPETGVSIDVRV